MTNQPGSPPSPRPDGRPADARAIPLAELAAAFLVIGATSFGGGLTGYLRKALVVERRWLTEEEFLRGLSVAQTVPGPNAVNLAVFAGYRAHGPAGSAVAVLSVFLVPLLALAILAALWSRWGGVPAVQGALGTLAAFGAGLMAATGMSMFRAARLARKDVLLAAAAFVAVGLLRWPVPAVFAALLPVSLWLHRGDGTAPSGTSPSGTSP